jgi:hypothetical protein
MLQVEMIDVTEQTETLSDNNAGEGQIRCSCGQVYTFSLRNDQNMVDYMGFLYPRCPECKKTPSSENRRIDL